MKRPRSPYAPRRSKYAAAAAIAVAGLVIAVTIAVVTALATGNIPTAPSSYDIQVVGAAGPGAATGPAPGGAAARSESGQQL
jgi:hypothetical protein